MNDPLGLTWVRTGRSAFPFPFAPVLCDMPVLLGPTQGPCGTLFEKIFAWISETCITSTAKQSRAHQWKPTGHCT